MSISSALTRPVPAYDQSNFHYGLMPQQILKLEIPLFLHVFLAFADYPIYLKDSRHLRKVAGLGYNKNNDDWYRWIECVTSWNTDSSGAGSRGIS